MRVSPLALSTRNSFRLAFLLVSIFLLLLAFKSVLIVTASSGKIPTIATPKAAKTSMPVAAPAATQAQTINTIFHLRMEGNQNGVQNETPTQPSTVTFFPGGGVIGQAAFVDRNARLTYESAGNINATEGTIELWIKPAWSGSDTQSRTILRYGGGGGLIFGKEGSTLRLALNRANENGSAELEVETNIQSWRSEEWHYIAASWSNSGKFLRLYVDGTLMAERLISSNVTLPTVDPALNPTFQIAGDGIRSQLSARIDEIKISDGARSLADIRTNMLFNDLFLVPSGVQITSATLDAISLPNGKITLYPGWSFWQDIRFNANTNIGPLTIPATLGGFDSSKITIDPVSSRVKALAAGTTNITATVPNGTPVSIPVEVLTAGTVDSNVTIPTDLATPMSGARTTIPVAIVRYIPTNGSNLASVIPGYNSTIDNLNTKLTSIERKLKFILEEGSRFRGSGIQNLGYRVAKIITVNEPVPPGLPDASGSKYFPDYKQIFQRLDLKTLVENQGVKEIWLEQYVNGEITLNESNLSSPYSNDVSSSLQTNDDLPAYTKSFTVFGINYGLLNGVEQFEHHAARHFGHHLEALLTFANVRQDGNDLLFQESFIGRDANGNFLKGRCGKTDRPPNSDNPLEFNNSNPVLSDIHTWTPDQTGNLESVSRVTWGDRIIAGAPFWENKDESQWHIYWRQAIPGFGNTIQRFGTENITNWWNFVSDWDNAMINRVGLTKAIACTYSLSSISQTLSNSAGGGSFSVIVGAGCRWRVTQNTNWITISPNTTEGVGSGTVNFTVAANAAGTRNGTITITDRDTNQSITHTVTQATSNPAPTITSLQPASVIAGGAELPLTINGTNFVSSSVVQVNDVTRTSTLNNNQLTVSLTAADIAIAGKIKIAVVTPAPGGGTATGTLDVNNPVPTLTSLSRSSATAGDAGFNLTVTGTNFISTSKVLWKGTERVTTFVSATQLNAAILTDDLTSAGSANVTVTNPPPDGGTTSALTFTINAPCSYSLTPSTQNFGVSGGNGSVNVTANTGCAWTATSNANWITINSGSSGAGNGTVGFTVASNSGDARNGTLTIQGQTFTVTQDAVPASCIGQRTLPTGYIVGQANQISIQVTPSAATQSYAVEETPPAGWTVSAINNNGQFDAVNNKVKWGPFFDATARTLTYVVTPPTGTTGQKAFSGTVSVNGASQAICGNTTIAAAILVHPADLNNNFRLEINELTSYGAAWKAGTPWSRPPNPIDINYITNAGLLWKLGEAYRYDATRTPPFAPEANTSLRQPLRYETNTAYFSSEENMRDLIRAMGYTPGIGFGWIAALTEPTTANMAGIATASFSAASYSPNVGITVTLNISPDSTTQVYAVEDTVPAGWTVTNINNSGAFDSNNRKVKWGPFFDNSNRSLTYVITPPAGESGSKSFTGSVSFDGVSVVITGARAIAPAPACSYTLGASSQSVSASGGTGSFTITAPSGCSWNATTGDSWLTITQGSGSGNGAVNFTAAANPGAARTGTISVAGQSFTVNQSVNAAPVITPPIETSGSAQRTGSVLLYSVYSSSLGNPGLENTQIRLTNTHETQATAVRLYLIDSQSSSVFSLFVCLPPNQTTSLLMSEIDPSVTGYIIAVAVDKTTGCPVNFNFLTGSAAIKLTSGHSAFLSAMAMTALSANPTTCVTGSTSATLNFDGTSYSRLPRLLIADNLVSLRDGNNTRLIVNRVGGTLVGKAGALGTIQGRIYNSARAAQDFTVTASTPLISNTLSSSFPRLTTRFDSFISAGQSGWMKLWTESDWGIIGAVLNVSSNPYQPSAFTGGYNLSQGAVANAVSLEIPIAAPNCP